MRRSPTCRRTAATLTSGRARSTSTSIRYFHTAALYDGLRRDIKDRARSILARDAYLGAQHNGTIFWSSDICANVGHAEAAGADGLEFVASGMPYWSTDIGGWQYLPEIAQAGASAADRSLAMRATNVGGYDDYPELYVRWFEYGAFQPNFRAHGSRPHNEVWSYGKQAEPILEKYLRLRYQLMPYIYSLGYADARRPARRSCAGCSWTSAPIRRWPIIGDEYMFGPALLVAPVTEQGVTTRQVYLPAGTDWYNFWTNERVHGGQTITVSAPIDTLPLFVRAGSIAAAGRAGREHE